MFPTGVFPNCFPFPNDISMNESIAVISDDFPPFERTPINMHYLTSLVVTLQDLILHCVIMRQGALPLITIYRLALPPPHYSALSGSIINSLT